MNKNIEFASWKNLDSAVKLIYPKATLGLMLIYVIHYLRIGGINTESLERTLVGCLVALACSALVGVLIPKTVAKHESSDEYENYIQAKVSKGYINANCWAPELSRRPLNVVEASKLDYIFDQDFAFTSDNIRMCLGEIGVISLFSKLQYFRANISQPYTRGALAVLMLASILLMYQKPLTLLIQIFTKH